MWQYMCWAERDKARTKNAHARLHPHQKLEMQYHWSHAQQ